MVFQIRFLLFLSKQGLERCDLETQLRQPDPQWELAVSAPRDFRTVRRRREEAQRVCLFAALSTANLLRLDGSHGAARSVLYPLYELADYIVRQLRDDDVRN